MFSHDFSGSRTFSIRLLRLRRLILRLIGETPLWARLSLLLWLNLTEYEDMIEQLRQYHVPLKLCVSEGSFSICVAVCREASGVLRVVHVEGRKERLDKDWVRGVSRHLIAEAERVLESAKLKEDVVRDLLIGLNATLRRRLLAIPDRYSKLTDELLNYSYGKPASGHALSLALAVDTSRKQKSN